MTAAGFARQEGYDIRCEWGARGVEVLEACRTIIVVDVLSFCTCVAVAAEAGAEILPWAGDEAGARDLATSRGALLAGRREDRAGYSLSPASFVGVPSGIRVVLPSPNGATLSLAASGRGFVLAGCMRNRAATCAQARLLGGPFGVIAAGERWPDGSLRPAVEDWLGAGAIVAGLPGVPSPEATAASAAFAAASDLAGVLRGCASGRELIDKGFSRDVELAAELDRGPAVRLAGGAFLAAREVPQDTYPG
jgi:2-phosphosulfolactate phosphatase